jgi:hypothetical protein
MRRLLFLCILAASTMPALAHAAVNRTLATLPSNTALDLGGYTCDQPSDNPDYCESITDYSNFVYDPVDETMLMFGGGHSATHRTDVDVFSFETLEWSSAYPSMACADMDAANNLDPATGFWTSSGHPVQRHTYDLTIVLPDTHELVLLGGGAYAGNCLFGLDQGQLDQIDTKIAHYDVAAQSWTASTASAQYSFAGSDYDPETGLAVLFDGALYTYDPAAQVVAYHASFGDLGHDFGYANNLVFFPPDGHFYYFTRGEPTGVFRLALDRSDLAASTVTQLAPAGDSIATGESGFAYDASNQIIGGGVTDGVFLAYDPTADTWITRAMEIDPASESAAIGTVAFHALSYDPVNNVFLFVSDNASGRRTWAYRFGRCEEGSTEPCPECPEGMRTCLADGSYGPCSRTCEPNGTDDGSNDTSGGAGDSGTAPTTSVDDGDGTSGATAPGETTEGSTDAAMDDSDDAGCGCRSHGAPGAPCALALFLVRRRRSRLVRS